MKIDSWEEIEVAIKQLRSRLEDMIDLNKKFDSDFLLYRWFIHHNTNIDRTEKAIRESIEWRKKNNVDVLGEQEWGWETPGIEKSIAVSICGVSKKGQPVVTINGEGVDLATLLKKYGKEGCRRYFIQWYVKLEKLMIESAKKANQVILDNGEPNQRGKINPSWLTAAPLQIVSYKNYSLWNATSVDGLQVIAESFKIGMTYFPCCVSAVYAVNLNTFSNLVVKTMKPLLTTQAFVMEFFDTDKSKWSKALLELIDEDQLPQYFGGTQPDAPHAKA